MSKLNEIEGRILQLDGGSFQKLANAYLHRKGYERLNPLGSVIGANKTRVGTPDALVTQDSGKYVLAEHTTQRQGLFKKLEDDVRKCLSTKKSGLPVEKIEEIVLCHTGLLTGEEENRLAERCQSAGVNLSLFGIGPISYDLYQKYPGLARDFLGVEVDSGQVLPLRDFVEEYGRNALTPPLTTSFRFREAELAQALEGLEGRDLLILAGGAGIGKSRFAVECLERFLSSHPHYKVRCILNRGPDLFEDLRVHFAQPGKYLLLVDDANRVNRFEYVVQLVQRQSPERTIKVVVTVRDYAAEKIRQQAAQVGDYLDMTLDRFGDKELSELVKDEYEIRNQLFIDRICEIAQGNPRLAVMAAQVAKRDDTLSIPDVSDLYGQYYSTIRGDLEQLDDNDVLKVGGVIAFFRTVDRSHTEMMEAIETAFGISPDSFWASAKRLHELEAVNLYEDQVVRSSDQVLATYLFHRAFFEAKDLDFAAVLDHFFPGLSERLVDALSPAISVYSNRLIERMRPFIDAHWTKLKASGDEETFLRFVQLFWFFKQTEVLMLIRDRIECMTAEDPDPPALKWEKEYSGEPHDVGLSLLSRFSGADKETLEVALALSLDYLAKRPSDAHSVLSLLTKAFGFKFSSYMWDFAEQEAVVDSVWDRSKRGDERLPSLLFLQLAGIFLRTEFEETSSKSRRTLSIRQFQLPATPQLHALREKILGRVFSLYATQEFQVEVLEVLRRYVSAGYRLTGKEAIATDSKLILPFIANELDPASYKHCQLVHDYLDLLGQQELEVDGALRSRFESRAYLVSRLLRDDWAEVRESKLEYGEYEKQKAERIRAAIAEYDLSDFQELFEICDEIYAALSSGPDEYQLATAMERLFLGCADQDPDLFPLVVGTYLERGQQIPFHPGAVIGRLVELVGADRAFEILSRHDFDSRQRWLFSFYSSLPPEAVTEERLRELCELYRDSPIEQISRDVDALLRYLPLDKRIVARVTAILLERAKDDPRYANALSLLFNPHTKANESLIELFSEDVGLLKAAYLADCEADRHTDYDGRTLARILDVDSSFLLEYVEWMYSQKEYISRHDDSRDYSFLWLRDDADDLIAGLVARIREIEAERPTLFYSYLATFFRTKEGAGKATDEVRERQDRFIEKLIKGEGKDIELMQRVFRIVSDFPEERRRQFVALFLKTNENLDDFRQLALEPSIGSWSGSAVPYYQERANYIESLLPLVNKVELLQHKLYLESVIAGLRSQIEVEKKRDFLEDW